MAPKLRLGLHQVKGAIPASPLAPADFPERSPMVPASQSSSDGLSELCSESDSGGSKESEKRIHELQNLNRIASNTDDEHSGTKNNVWVSKDQLTIRTKCGEMILDGTGLEFKVDQRYVKTPPTPDDDLKRDSHQTLADATSHIGLCNDKHLAARLRDFSESQEANGNNSIGVVCSHAGILHCKLQRTKQFGDERPKPIDFKRKFFLAKGAHGEVHLVSYCPPGAAKETLYAEKIIYVHAAHDDVTAERQAKALFSELMAVTNCLDSPYIVPSYEAFVRYNEVSIIMELMNLGSLVDLRGRILKSNIPPQAIPKLTVQILKGLEYLHSQSVCKAPIIHRDLKPANILINQEGFVKISDFGCSACVSDDSCLSYPGTDAYKAPEYYSKGSKITTKADIWSLGLTLYDCMFGSLPWARSLHLCSKIGSGTFDMWAEVKQTEQLAHFRSKHIHVADFIEKCLTLDPEHRPDAEKLLEHPMVTGLENPEKWLAAWIEPNLKKRKKESGAKSAKVKKERKEKEEREDQD